MATNGWTNFDWFFGRGEWRRGTRGRSRHALWKTSPLVSGAFFLVRCLIAATAYDEKFVNQLLSNRSLIDNGDSLNGTSLYELKNNAMEEHSVRCIINIENWTAWKLKDALSHNHCGYIHDNYPAPNVMPAQREVMVGHKQGGTATGTCGTVSWQIQHMDTRLIVMWSVPFNFNIHDSYFAVGMIFNRGKFTSSSYWFNQMYYSEKGAYKRGSGGQTITFENSAIVVHAHMEGSTYHPLLNISIIPQVPYKLAPLVWKRLYKNERARYTGGASTARSAAAPTSFITSACIFWWLWNRTYVVTALLATGFQHSFVLSYFS